MLQTVLIHNLLCKKGKGKSESAKEQPQKKVYV